MHRMLDRSLIFTVHAVRRMFARGIRYDDVKTVLETGRTIEKYPDSKPYPSRLVLGWAGTRPIHVVVADDEKDAQTIIVTVYEPDLFNWLPGFERRREP